jgi:hypothetical protein
MQHGVKIIAVALLCLALASGAHAAAKKTPAAAVDSTAVTRGAAARPARKEPVRTLDAIRIEGEIDVPQVLFITARDYRRFRDGAGSRQATSGRSKSIAAGRLRGRRPVNKEERKMIASAAHFQGRRTVHARSDRGAAIIAGRQRSR